MSPEFTIDVRKIEELQTIGDTDALEAIFDKARRTVIGGGMVALVRPSGSSEPAKFDEITNEEDLANYRQNVFKYLDAE